MDLCANHRHMLLEDSGIPEGILVERGYRTVTQKAELAELGFSRPQQRVPGLLIPVHDVHGEVSLYQLRPDDPRTDRKRGKPIKYETPRGACMVIDVPPRARADLGDPTVPLYVTEGAKKADAAVAEGLCCVALMGVTNWRGTNAEGGKTALACWESIALNEREVVIAFDSDVMTKPQVHKALKRLRTFLASRKAKVSLLYLPEGEGGAKVGLDDFFAQGKTTEDLRELLSKDLRQPAPDLTGASGKPRLEIGHDLKLLCDHAERLLACSPLDVFARGRVLIRVLRGPVGSFLDLYPQASAKEDLSSLATWLRQGKDGHYPTTPPDDLVRALLARGSWSSIPNLVDLLNHPTLRADGSVIEARGFDRATGLYLDLEKPFPPVPHRPSFTDAQLALDELRGLLADFPFESETDGLAAIALALTLLVRHLIQGPLPVFLITAPQPGTGKTLLAQVTSSIATGRNTPIVTLPPREEELRKQLLALAVEGKRVVIFDNVVGQFGSPAIAAITTSRTFSDRLLGQSATAEADSPLLVATGNNLEVTSDLFRRVLPIRLSAGVERPEQRTGFAHPNLLSWTLRQRPRLVVAALTLLRWAQSADLDCSPSAFGSYEAWSEVIRKPLLALTGLDPLAGCEKLREESDPAHEALRTALELLEDRFGSAPFLSKQVCDLSGEPRAALVELACCHGVREPLTSAKVGRLLGRLRGAIVNGCRLERLPRHGAGTRWQVQRVQPANAPSTAGCTSEAPTRPELAGASAEGAVGSQDPMDPQDSSAPTSPSDSSAPSAPSITYRRELL